MGVAEQNMASVASGMAAMGKIPFIGSYAVFSPGRNWEQIRTTICYNGMPVKIVGSHTGVNVGADGGSHQSLEDIALTRVLPGMTVLSPCDAEEARKAAIIALKIKGPVYIRLPREASTVITTVRTPVPYPHAQTFWTPPRGGKPSVGIISTGTITKEALIAAAKLEEKGIASSVMNIFSIKPMDESAVSKLAKDSGAIVVAEEHQIYGGLGGAIAEVLSRKHNVPIEFIGVSDEFGQSGKPDELRKRYHLTSDDIVAAALRVKNRRDRSL
jgi:transketolase